MSSYMADGQKIGEDAIHMALLFQGRVWDVCLNLIYRNSRVLPGSVCNNMPH